MGRISADEHNGTIKRCAFCKYWYDPTNTAISPTFGKGKWLYETGIKNKCMQKNVITPSTNTCPKFDLKF